MTRTIRLAARGALLGLLATAGCDGETEIRTYQVSATPSAATTAPAALPAQPMAQASTQPAAVAGNSAGPLHWTLPAGWRQVPGERTMRVATFETTQGERLEISLARFPGDTGGLLANVNRWRGQVGLGAIEEKDLAAGLKPVDNGSLRGHTLRLRGESQHMLGAILAPADNSESWFVKATAAPAVIDANEAAFEAFVKSMHLDVDGTHQH